MKMLLSEPVCDFASQSVQKLKACVSQDEVLDTDRQDCLYTHKRNSS